MSETAELPPTAAPAADAPANRMVWRRADGARAETDAAARHDFRMPASLADAEFRRLRAVHEDFARYLAARLSLCLRMEFGLKLVEFETVPYAKFTDSLPQPAHLTLFKADPLHGVGILDMSAQLALTIAERLLGGRGRAVKGGRMLTEIETALLEDVTHLIIQEWCDLWKADFELKPTLIGHETNGRFLQTSPRDVLMIVCRLESNFGDCREPLQVAVPYLMLEPAVKKMQARRRQAAIAAAAPKRPAWQPAFDHIALPCRVEWAAFEVPVREIGMLRVGDVLELPAAICNDTRVLLDGTLKFVGTVGLENDRVAVQLTRSLSSEEIHHAKSDGRKDA